MHTLEVDGQPYKYIENWSEMKLSEAIELHSVLLELPEPIRESYRLMFDPDGEEKAKKLDISDEDVIKHAPEVYCKVIKILTDIPENLVDLIGWNERTEFYNKFLASFCIGLLNTPFDYEPKNIESFEHNGNKYFLPGSQKDVHGEDRPMINTTAIEFTESVDLELAAKQVESGKYAYIKNVISILCRPKDEPYSETVCLNRAEEFETLTMDVVWEVFFCLIRSSHISQLISRT